MNVGNVSEKGQKEQPFRQGFALKEKSSSGEVDLIFFKIHCNIMHNDIKHNLKFISKKNQIMAVTWPYTSSCGGLNPTNQILGMSSVEQAYMLQGAPESVGW